MEHGLVIHSQGIEHAHDGDADDDGHDRRDDGAREGLAQPEVLHQAHERDDEQLSYLRSQETALRICSS